MITAEEQRELDQRLLRRYANELAAAKREEKCTLRDQFAMAALTGCVGERCDESLEVVATLAYQYADAMLKAREGK